MGIPTTCKVIDAQGHTHTHTHRHTHTHTHSHSGPHSHTLTHKHTYWSIDFRGQKGYICASWKKGTHNLVKAIVLQFTRNLMSCVQWGCLCHAHTLTHSQTRLVGEPQGISALARLVSFTFRFTFIPLANTFFQRRYTFSSAYAT